MNQKALAQSKIWRQHARFMELPPECSNSCFLFCVDELSSPGCMDWLTNLIWHDGKFLGIAWSVWKVVGWCGNAAFCSRFLVQWYATEKLRRVVVPTTFWWLSLLGSLIFLAYSIHQRDSVFIFAYAFNWIPYIRNLIIHRRHQEAHIDCSACGTSCAPQSNFCSACGARLSGAKAVS